MEPVVGARNGMVASIARGRSLGFAILLLISSASHHLCQASQQHRTSLFRQDVGLEPSGPEDLLLEELVRNWKWAAQQRHNMRDDDDVGLVFGDEEDQQPAFRQQQPVVSKAEQKQRQRQHPFAYRPRDPEFNGIQLSQQDDVISVPAEPQRLNGPADAGSEPLIPRDFRVAGQKENIFDEAPEDVAENGKFSNIVAKASSAASYDEDGSSEPVAHAIVGTSKGNGHHDSLADIYLTALVAGCTASAVAAILALGVCFYRWQRRAKSAQDVEYPAYGITGPGPSPSGKSSLKSSPSSSVQPGGLGSWGAKSPKAASGDKKLAHSAHMFHFQHQKQQVIAMESHAGCERRGSNSGGESDEDNEEGDYTVYECPGLAPTGEMEVKNPLFLDDPTPASPAKKRQSE